MNSFIDLDDAKTVLEKMTGQSFTTHDFIAEYSHEYEAKYTALLNRYAARHDKGIHRIVHAAIGLFLLHNAEKLGISSQKEKDINSRNIFRRLSRVEKWQ